MYTYVGEILVAVNPFKTIKGIYDPDKMRQSVANQTSSSTTFILSHFFFFSPSFLVFSLGGVRGVP